MPEPQVFSRRRADRRLSGRVVSGRAGVAALGGLICVAALTAPSAPVAAASVSLKQHTGTVTRLTALQDWRRGGYLASAATDAAADSGSGTAAGSMPVSVTVPPAGEFTVTVTAGTVTLAMQGGARNATPIATGLLPVITVAEARNYLPGWSVVGQASSFTAAGQPTSGAQLGWIPTGTVTGGAKLGPPVAPGHPGIGSAGAVLASAAAGSGIGTDTLTAELMLAIPPSAENGPYGVTLTITFVETAPEPVSPAISAPSAR